MVKKEHLGLRETKNNESLLSDLFIIKYSKFDTEKKTIKHEQSNA